MKRLSDLYPVMNDTYINDIKTNSKEVKKNDLFVCIKGVTKDRNDYIEEAIENGASAIVTDLDLNIDIPVIKVKNPNRELIKLSKKFYDFDNKLNLIAVTGTNGKTTIASYIKDLIGSKCGYMGTNGIKSNSFNRKTKNTTPSPDKLYKYFNEFKNDSCNYVSMEASSEAFYRKRLSGLYFNVGILSNVTEDHLNVHKTIDNYIECKKELFKHVRKNGYSIINIDDKWSNQFLDVAKGTILTYGMKESTLQIIAVKEYDDKTDIELKYNKKIYRFSSNILGLFNVYNLCAAMLSLIALGYDINYIIKRLNKIKVPKGRMEFLNFNQDYKIILDYAHTKDAFIKDYLFLNKIKKKRIITVTGSAGGREHEKRKYIGEVVLNNSDLVIFTMDDPRYEDVNSIIDELIGDCKKDNYIRIINREDAIAKALSIAKKDDIVLIAGKGRDNYMAIEDKYIKYCDYDVIRKKFIK